MSGSLSLTVADRLLAEIARLAAERGPAELELPAEYERLKQRTDADYRAALKQVHAEHAAAREQAEQRQAALRRGILKGPGRLRADGGGIRPGEARGDSRL